MMTVMVGIPCLLTGGTEVQTLSGVRALVGGGWRVVVVCYFEWAPAMVRAFEEAGAEVRCLAARGDAPRPVGVRATWRWLLRGFRSVVREARPQMAWIQYMAPGALAVVAARAAGISRIMATAHTAADIYSPMGRRVIRALCATGVIGRFQCITERAERSFFGSSHLLQPDDSCVPRHFTIHNVLPGHIAVRAADDDDHPFGDCLTVGVVSRLEEIKGMDLVVPSFSRVALSPSGRRVRLLVVGDGSLRSMMEQQARDLGVAHCVEFAGRQGADTLQGYYDRIDILLMPSRSEGFGLTAIEGMARGCVPLVADVGGLPEVVTADCGVLHAPADATHLAAQLAELAAAPAERLTALSRAARTRAADFTAPHFSARLRRALSL